MPQKIPRAGVQSQAAAGLGPVSRESVRARTRELALIAGRVPPHVAQADYEQAKRELTGESDLERQEAMLESFQEAKRGETVPGSPGHRAPESRAKGEDGGGRSETEQFVDEGAAEAARDRLRPGAKTAGKSEP